MSGIICIWSIAAERCYCQKLMCQSLTTCRHTSSCGSGEGLSQSLR
jgi:hypothetical protein